VDEIISNIEKDSTGSNVAILAFVDPYALSHFEWSSLEKLSKFHHIDVIFTLPTSSYVRNKANYRDFEKYVPRLNEHEKKDIESGKIDQKSLSEIYARGLANLIKTTIRYYKEGVIIKNSKNSEIYRITLFTRSEVGARIMYNLVSRLNRMDNREIEVEIQKITGIQSPLSKFFK
jgi:three-Cys-motif partner protein